ncbi:MAG: radical SAM protein [Candidatus Altiarchaeota archaeon]
MKKLDDTKSYCPECLEIIDAIVVEESGRVFIAKKCDKHGDFKALHMWEKPKHYHALRNLFRESRHSSYPEALELFITYRCNQKCPYCFAESDENACQDELTYDGIIQMLDGFKGSRIYLIGGEPTVRDDLAEIIKEIKKRGFDAILFTNGKKLEDMHYVETLKKAGLDMVILQFDSFSRQQCIQIRGEDLLDVKNHAVENLKKQRIPIMPFVLVIKGLNDDQIGDFIKFSSSNYKDVCVLDFNSVWNIGRRPQDNTLTQAEIIEEIQKASDLTDDDFIESTVFAYNFFEIIRKISGRKGLRVPECEIRCYVLTNGREMKALGKTLDLHAINKRLDDINRNMGQSKTLNTIRLIANAPYMEFLRGIIKDMILRRVLLSSSIDVIRSVVRRRPMKLKFPGIFSILIGRFHELDNIDLGLVSTCTLHANLPSGKHASFCERELFRNAGKMERLCDIVENTARTDMAAKTTRLP